MNDTHLDDKPQQPQHFRVLVVDDEPAVVTQLSDGLRVLGYDVLQASSVHAALSILASDPAITVVVSDVRMPESDGLGLARHIMNERTDSDAVEVVLITGHATIEDAAAAVRARAVDFLRKPFRLREAGDAVARANARATARRRKIVLQKQIEQKLRELDSQPSGGIADSQARPDALAASLIPHDGENAHRREVRAISHALRTPLVAIAGGADLLTRDVEPSDLRAHEHLGLLRNGIKDAIAAVTLVEELKQLDSAPPAAEPADIDAAAMLDSILRGLQAQGGLGCLALLPIAPASVLLRFRPEDLRRLFTHCLLSVAEWAPAQSRLRIGWTEPTSSTAALSLQVVAPDGVAAPATPAPASALARTQEGLRFSIAERLASRNNATLQSHGGGDGQMTLILHAPRGTAL
ncbi:Response regulator receiver domain-containing protein [Falsiroseomonas stagni DSM 19981]|uniref:histidine kinase n=2 Tax=Falsiroseomonas TaxID=2870713 RepID=A0A1I4EYV7_9PROT|nr:Response regulator receiver domain-containing protein [Falsiroseomonas stagni DSM 19981]